MRGFILAFILFFFLTSQVSAQTVIVVTATPSVTSSMTPTLTSIPSPIPTVTPSQSPTPTVEISPVPTVTAGPAVCGSVKIDERTLGFRIPSLGDLLTFVIKAFFALAGIAALFMLLLGAFMWVTSGGDKANVEAAQKRIQAAIVGIIMIVVVLSIVWTLENVIFARTICFGISCPITLPPILKPVGNPSTPGCITPTPSPATSAAVPTVDITGTSDSTVSEGNTSSKTPLENPPQILPDTGK